VALVQAIWASGGKAYEVRRTFLAVAISIGAVVATPSHVQGQATSDRNTMTAPAGTRISVRNNDPIDSQNASPGQTFSANVIQDVQGGAGEVLIPKDSPAELVVRQSSSGGTTGTSELVLDLESITVNGHRYLVSSEDVTRRGNQGLGKNRRTAEMVGGGAVLGTVLGAIAGGGKGAAIGAVAGGAAGGTAQVLTKGKQVKVPAETVLSFQLDKPLHLVSGE
jgi:hypothetical protein